MVDNLLEPRSLVDAFMRGFDPGARRHTTEAIERVSPVRDHKSQYALWFQRVTAFRQPAHEIGHMFDDMRGHDTIELAIADHLSSDASVLRNEVDIDDPILADHGVVPVLGFQMIGGAMVQVEHPAV